MYIVWKRATHGSENAINRHGDVVGKVYKYKGKLWRAAGKNGHILKSPATDKPINFSSKEEAKETLQLLRNIFGDEDEE